MTKFAALALLFFPLLASADCTDQLQAWANTLKPDLKFDSERAVCKVNPANAGLILAALPFAETVDEDGQGDYGLGVIMADAASGKIVARHYQSAAITSDAISFESLSLDTARYQLTPQLRAFGVRISYDGASRVNPFASTTLNLYVLDGTQLRPVMNTLEVSRSGGEWDGMCDGEFTRTLRTLSMAKKNSNGFSSLDIDEKVIHTRNQRKGEDCQRTEGKPASSSLTLDYDGSQYAVPSGLSYP
ncbi:hypothetical protein PSCICJ_02730 [Pseudomonas cichorii]|uniref:hypothetical protein n=1 Tax=Pseudomonas cichorii TaxID=36746 RepID=UPI001910B56E|nr:hypothetical protein [Pseudomonas cichorii]GFM64155.1 hypothetical protein PSCICJ_02730 [Pseudomonas cichorii]